MKIHWIYRCDEGHEWEFYRDENAEVRPEDRVCAYGHPAVTLQKQRPLDLVQITLRPGARIVDPVKNQVDWERFYWLIISDIDETERRVSEKLYLWRNVLALAERFQGKTRAAAWELWDKLAP